MNKPDVFKLFSTTDEISDPIFFFFNIFSKLSLEFSSIYIADTAIGNGFRFPLVISTSIKLYDLIGKKITTKIAIIIFFISLAF